MKLNCNKILKWHIKTNISCETWKKYISIIKCVPKWGNSLKNYFFSITLINHPVIYSESSGKVCLEKFVHANLMDICSSLYAYCVPFLYTFLAKIPHKFSLSSVNQGFLPASPEISENWFWTMKVMNKTHGNLHCPLETINHHLL